MNLKIIESSNEVAYLALQEMATMVNAKTSRILPAVNRKVGNLLVELINDEDTFQAISENLLRGLLGLTVSDAAAAQDLIRATIRDDYEVKRNRLRAKRDGSGFDKPLFEIGLIERGNERYRGLVEYTSSNGFTINWLDWLLFHGSEFVVNDHSPFNVGNSQGRAGLGLLMVEGNAFIIPAEHAGTKNRNFVTNAIVDKRNKVKKELELIFETELNRL